MYKVKVFHDRENLEKNIQEFLKSNQLIIIHQTHMCHVTNYMNNEFTFLMIYERR
jgi:hypothetical protein